MPPLEWLLHPALLEFLRRMPVERSSGDPNATDATARNFPAVRALSRALYVLSLLGAEQARLGAANAAASPAEQRDAAQTSALLAFLDAVALSAVLESWGSPRSVGGELSGFLSELDRGFAALVFGFAEGEIGFVYDPARPQPTNFEQLLLAHATPALNQFVTDEQAFLNAERGYEQNQELLQHELERVRTSQDESLMRVCGSAFDAEAVESEQDWAECGADGTGEIAELSLDIEQAHLRMQAAEGRVLAANRKIDIDLGRLADSQKVHQGTLAFIDATAKRLHVERERTLARVLESSVTDPLHRVLQDRLALQALDSRARAQRWLYRAGRALEYEINTPLGSALGRALLGAYNGREVERRAPATRPCCRSTRPPTACRRTSPPRFRCGKCWGLSASVWTR